MRDLIFLLGLLVVLWWKWLAVTLGLALVCGVMWGRKRRGGV